MHMCQVRQKLRHSRSYQFCRNCRTNSTFEDCVIKDVSVYTITENVKAESNWFIIATIREILAEKGLTVESPAILKGKSGANHSFDIAAYKGSEQKLWCFVSINKLYV